MRSSFKGFAFVFAIVAVTGLGHGARVFAQTAEVQRVGVEGVRNMTNQVTRLLQNNMSKLDPGCFVDCGDYPRASQACADAYADLYSKPVVKMSVTLGYTDVEQGFADAKYNYLAAEDSIRREVWEQKLLRDCRGAVGTCGFKKDPDDADLFQKIVQGPDGKDHVVELRFSHSSASYSDAANRAAGRAQQELQTRTAESAFYEGARADDVSIYAGHWRNGGGPSFAPPTLKSGTLAVNFKAYADHAAEQRLLTTLRSNPNPPKILGYFACNSALKSSEELRAATRNKSGVITSSSLAEPEIVFAQAYAALDSILAMRCATEFDSALNSVVNIKRKDGKGTQRIGFFNDEHPRFQFPEEESAVPADKRSQTPLAEKPIHPSGEAQSSSSAQPSSGDAQGAADSLK